MKFTDGYWLLRPNVTAAHPAQIDQVVMGDGRLTLYAPAKPQNQRADSLDGQLLTIQFSSPMADVIRVTLTHFAGAVACGPNFEIHEARASGAVAADDGKTASLTAGKLSVRVGWGRPWRVDFLAEGRVLTCSETKGMGAVTLDGAAYMHEQLSLDVGECVYGLGERFSAFVKNGQVVDIWNQDGGTSSEQTYKNVPFYLTNRGYGVFVNNPGPVSFEVASEKVERVQFSAPGQSLEYFVIYGPSPRAILEKYTALSGRPALPPPWSFGLWLTTSFTTSYDEATVAGFVQGMADRRLPLHVFHFDCFWMREFNWCDFRWDERTFPDPAGMLARLKARGLHICVWINPYIAQRSPLFAEGMQAGYLVRRPNGDVWQIDRWQAGMAIVDFTNPAARRWFGDKLRTLLDMGVDCFKTDFGERIPVDAVYADGSDPARMHNYYSYLYNQTVFDVLRERRGEGDAVVFARSATAGGQRFPVHWGGDSESSFRSMAESLRGGLSLGLSGFGFWSHDIGGFEGKPPAEVYKRWIAFGLLSSHSRLHGSGSYRVPWLFDEEAVDVLRHFTQLKCRLMPYLFAQAVAASNGGVPVMRAMLLEYPDDPGCDYLDRQYMLGDSLLVAPVFSGSGDVDYYVPAGRWTHLLTGEVVTGPGWRRETHDYMSLPLLVRPGSLLVMGNDSERPDYDYAAGFTARLYEIADGAKVEAVIPSHSGETVATLGAQRTGSTLAVTWQGPIHDWQIVLVNQADCAGLEGGTAEACPEGLRIRPDSQSNRIMIRLD